MRLTIPRGDRNHPRSPGAEAFRELPAHDCTRGVMNRLNPPARADTEKRACSDRQDRHWNRAQEQRSRHNLRKFVDRIDIFPEDKDSAVRQPLVDNPYSARLM
jgi:hypothetical protein